MAPIDPTPALSPRHPLARAIDDESRERHRYRRLAFRFLAFGQGISQLMAALGMECEARLAELRRQAGQPERAEDATPAGPSGEPDALIGDRDQALIALEDALDAAHEAVRRVMRLQAGGVAPRLQATLQAMTAQKRAECRILLELLEAQDPASRYARAAG